MFFPKWANKATTLVLLVVPLILVGAISAFAFYISPYTTQVGYAPEQPIPYSHKLHAGELGIDCRYCHTGAEQGPHAGVPPTETCMNCHTQVLADSPHIMKLAESYETGKPIEWVQIHRVPDFVYFDHSVHVNQGVGCVDCHGRIDHMEVVAQEEPLSMGWCLDCHREPEKFLRPNEEITNMAWVAEDQLTLGKELREQYHLNPTTNCSGCHR
ncbi:MAG: cytochrome c3 family protein [Candidatus Eisenbacteria bacterium]|uniref:Cytochrome c3 family protein n=1 Tax=Eiseniibacteriota bacterium TaxID=2212470 RepID=A0A7Y2E8A9_UNCEI|nr:cytochrome c3 family protein [Candidatus Eisenbacteria bacterium]